MAEAVFLDTVGLIALLNEDDSLHDKACEAFAAIGRSARNVVTTNLVLCEVGNGLARTSLRREVGDLIRELDSDPLAVVIHVSREQFEDGVQLYLTRPDKQWGLIDCISFTTMKTLGLREAFTADHHFEQAGLRVLLA
jgi:uncharacterized protein